MCRCRGTLWMILCGRIVLWGINLKQLLVLVSTYLPGMENSSWMFLLILCIIKSSTRNLGCFLNTNSRLSFMTLIFVCFYLVCIVSYIKNKTQFYSLFRIRFPTPEIKILLLDAYLTCLFVLLGSWTYLCLRSQPGMSCLEWRRMISGIAAIELFVYIRERR